MRADIQRRQVIGSVSRVMRTAVCVLPLAGCFDWSSLKSQPGGEGVDAGAAGDAGTSSEVAMEGNIDPFVAAATELESDAQKPFLMAAKPFIQAMVSRDYPAAFGHLAPTARQKFSRNQFIPAEDEAESARNDAASIVNPTAEQFVQLMQEVESTYGLPAQLDPPMVETDPEVLSRRDPVLAAYEIGAMPDSIPVDQRKAAVQAWVYCRMSDEQVKQAALEEGIDEAEYRVNMTEAEEGGEGPYFKIKTVVIDEGAGPVIGYFEIAPPSILD